MKRRTFLKIMGATMVAGVTGTVPKVFSQSNDSLERSLPFNFPKGLYTDVRVEDSFETMIRYKLGTLEELRERSYKAAFVRVFDGARWYYSSTSEPDEIQKEIDRLAGMAKPDENILSDSIVSTFQPCTGENLKFAKDRVSLTPRKEKITLLESFFTLLDSNPLIKNWGALYSDAYKIKRFYSSKGSDISWDYQKSGFSIRMNFSEGDKTFTEMFDKGANFFIDLKNQEEKLKERIKLGEEFLKNAKPVKPGKFPVILSPLAAGIFAHESFGHKSEADFMIGDETMKKEWAIGKKVGSDILSIVDDGNQLGVGHVPFDDEGVKARENYLIKNGILSGRLHSVKTAALFSENVTGNARAVDFEFEPIVRMTTTYIKPGKKTKDELISEVKDGFLIETISHGSGMSTFTLAPSRAYSIKDGKIFEPVQISVISGSVFETLNEIDGVSDTLELLSFVTGGCGKMDQSPLPVGFGGPYVRVKSMNVQ
ncbi:MAG: TldD/PmbA family protein [Candidatus Ozemobacteraceae bacterium]